MRSSGPADQSNERIYAQAYGKRDVDDRASKIPNQGLSLRFLRISLETLSRLPSLSEALHSAARFFIFSPRLCTAKCFQRLRSEPYTVKSICPATDQRVQEN